MRKIALSTLLIIISASMVTLAQLALPQPSPKASVMYTVGLTEVAVTYSSPAVNGREVFGKLVPYGEVWRTGANTATEISFSTDVMVAGKAVKAGKYALFTIPAENSWTVILNSNAGQWGSTNYKKDLDVLRFEVTPEKVTEAKERLGFYINHVSADEAHVVMKWDRIKIKFPVSVDSKAQAFASINKQFENTPADWYPLANAANYLTANGGNANDALMYANRAVALNGKHFMTHWAKAKAHEALGQVPEAIAAAQAAHKAGAETPSSWYDMTKPEIDEKIAAWSKVKPAKKK
ncbi:MAG: DUF2911 domain-containing protein [Sphingobacteriaceae bacterium]|nr:DUF2911 domain-containing protein [Sphingobacteriaceae bacterium]